MSAYVISEVDVRDPAGFEAYRTIAAKAIAHYGGRYLVRGGAASIADGVTFFAVDCSGSRRLPA